MSAPPSLRSFITLANTQGMDMAAITTPDIEATLLAKEQQAQRDADDDLVKVLEEVNCKCEDFANQRWDMQAAGEKGEVDQCEVDTKVGGKLLANAVVADVWRWIMHQAEKARLVAEKLQTEWEALRSPRKVRMKLGVSALPSFFIARG